MWIEPPANTSAPDATEPTMVTSPSGNRMVCPDRTGSRTSSPVSGGGGSAGAANSAGVAAGPVSRPPSSACAKPSAPGRGAAAPVTSTTRMPRRCNCAISVGQPESSAGSAAQSSTTTRPWKNAGVRAMCASSASNHASSGDSGASTKAMNERPRMRICGGSGVTGAAIS